MISKHVQELLQILNSAKFISVMLTEKNRRQTRLSIVFAQYSPLTGMDLVWELSNGKKIFPQDLEFATTKEECNNITIELGSYQFVCN